MDNQGIYDVVFIGAGPGGYVSAIRAVQLGLSVAVVEMDKVGGTCLNRGCIPSKSFLRSAEIYRNVLESEKFGVIVNDISLDFTLVKERKATVVEQLVKGIEFLFNRNGIFLIKGYGRISTEKSHNKLVVIEKENGEAEVITAKNIIIATGSRPKTLPGLKIDGKYIMTSDEAFEMEQLPKSIIIIGGGVIGMEWASLLNDFGVEVTVVEFLPRILSLEDLDISKDMTRIMKKRKVKIYTNSRVIPESINIVDNYVVLDVMKDGEVINLRAERTLVSVGREAVISDIGIENSSIKVEHGEIKVNEYYQTDDKNIYAIGDCIGGLQLAHVASTEGIIAVEHIAGKDVCKIDYLSIPRCTFTFPEVASMGLSEAEAIENGYEVKVGKFSFRGIGKALVYGEVDGFVKIVTDIKDNTILGVHMMGPHVTDMITEIGIAKILNATASDIAKTIHPHPTLTEAIMEAALAVDNRQIHG